MSGHINYKSRTLDNGLEVLSIKKESELMCLINAVKVGSLYEKEDEKGIAHFIEHMVFKGTEKRDNKKLVDDMEETGGDYDAYTDNDSTVFSITGLKEELPKCCEIFSDMMINSIFDEKELEKERKVIMSEIKNSYDDIEDFSFRKMKEIGFPEHVLRYDVLGTEECLKSFKRKELLEFYKKNYIPSRVKIIVASSYEHEEVFKIVEKYYAKWKDGKRIKDVEITTKNRAVEESCELAHNEQSTIMYMYTYEDATPEEALALRILDYRLGSSSNSILFKELREKRGLCYSVSTTLTNFKKFNILYIYASVAKEDIKESREVIEKCISELIQDKLKFHNKFFEVIKKVYKTEIASTLEGCNDIAHFIMAYILDEEDVMSFNKDIELIDHLKKEDILSAAKKLFKSPTISCITGRGEEK